MTMMIVVGKDREDAERLAAAAAGGVREGLLRAEATSRAVAAAFGEINKAGADTVIAALLGLADALRSQAEAHDPRSGGTDGR
jgi:hypothetical protein